MLMEKPAAVFFFFGSLIEHLIYHLINVVNVSLIEVLVLLIIRLRLTNFP